MPKYRVFLYTISLDVEVEADDEGQAVHKAFHDKVFYWRYNVMKPDVHIEIEELCEEDSG